MRRWIGCCALALLASVSTGCCHRGYVLRGSWSLGLDRQPCCTQGPDDGSAGAGCAAVDRGGAGCVAGGAGCAHRRAREAEGAGQAVVAGVPAFPGPGRFHPVPTRPVFGLPPEQVVEAAPPPVAPELAPLPTADPDDAPAVTEPPPANSAQRRPRSAGRVRVSNYRSRPMR